MEEESEGEGKRKEDCVEEVGQYEEKENCRYPSPFRHYLEVKTDSTNDCDTAERRISLVNVNY